MMMMEFIQCNLHFIQLFNGRPYAIYFVHGLL
jgi:hypothetical protein